MQDFRIFLESLKAARKPKILNTLIEGYSVLYEMPHTETKSGALIDMHVEDVYQKLGKEKTLVYVDELINKLENNLPIDFLFSTGDQLSHLDTPQASLEKSRLENLVYRLNLIKNNLK